MTNGHDAAAGPTACNGTGAGRQRRSDETKRSNPAFTAHTLPAGGVQAVTDYLMVPYGTNS